MSKIVKTLKRSCQYVKIACCGKRMRRQLFLEKLLTKANKCWFDFPSDVYRFLCKDLAFSNSQNYMFIKELRVEHLDIFLRRAMRKIKKNKRGSLIPIDILSIKAISSYEYTVELLQKKKVYNSKDPDSEEYNVVMSYKVEIPFREIEKEIWVM